MARFRQNEKRCAGGYNDRQDRRHDGDAAPSEPQDCAQDEAAGLRHQHASRHGRQRTRGNVAQIYSWMGETAREQIFAVLNRVLRDPSLMLKVFAYDLNEPDIVKILLTLAEQGRVRVILDNASLHITKKGAKDKTPEDQFTDLFEQRKKIHLTSYVGRSRASHTTRFSSSRGTGEVPSKFSPAPRISR